MFLCLHLCWVHDFLCLLQWQIYCKNKKVFKHFKNNYWTLITSSQSKKNKNFYCIHTLVMQVAYDIEPILPPPCYSLQMIYNHLQTPGSCLTDKWSVQTLRTSNTAYLKTTYRCCLYSLIFHCDCFFLTDTASKITPKKRKYFWNLRWTKYIMKIFLEESMHRRVGYLAILLNNAE